MKTSLKIGIASGIIVVIVLIVAVVWAMSGSPGSSEDSAAQSGQNPASSSIIQSQNTNDKVETLEHINVSIGGQQYAATLYDNAAGRDLASRLPITLNFRDFASGFDEKIGDLPSALSTQDMKDSDNGEPGEIGYWSPQPRVVLYTGEVGEFSGIHIIGRFDDPSSAVAAIGRQQDEFSASIQQAK